MTRKATRWSVLGAAVMLAAAGCAHRGETQAETTAEATHGEEMEDHGGAMEAHGATHGRKAASPEEVEAAHAEAREHFAIANLQGRSGVSLEGLASFVEDEQGKVQMTLTLKDAPPGEHAVHLHETGDCSAQDASSAGGHWNPTGAPHDRLGSGEPAHLGDVGNMTVGEDGTGTLEFETDLWDIGEGDAGHDILGKAVVVHASPDDYVSQPAGGAGARIACGVIVAHPER